jgi:hypothetical protein
LEQDPATDRALIKERHMAITTLPIASHRLLSRFVLAVLVVAMVVTTFVVVHSQRASSVKTPSPAVSTQTGGVLDDSPCITVVPHSHAC